MEKNKLGDTVPAWFLIFCLMCSVASVSALVYGCHRVFSGPHYVQPKLQDGEDPLDALKRDG